MSALTKSGHSNAQNIESSTGCFRPKADAHQVANLGQDLPFCGVTTVPHIVMAFSIPLLPSDLGKLLLGSSITRGKK